MRSSAIASIACALAAAATAAAAGTVTVPINHTMRLSVTGPAASVVVGNPTVADVTVVDSRTVFVSGRGLGSTDVTVLDSLGRTLFASEIQVAGPSHGQVAVYRGGTRSDMNCDPSCSPSGTTAGGVSAPTVGASSGVAAANAAAAMPGAIPAGVSSSVSNVAASIPIGR